MTSIRSILEWKGSTVFTVDKDATVFEAIGKMTRHDVGSLVVLDGADVAGIITERDYLRDIALQGRSSRSTAVGEIMSHPVVLADVNDSVDQCMAVMTEQRCRHLPVEGPDGLAGVVSIGDLVRQVVRDQKSEIRDLQEFIQGKYAR